MNGYMLDTTVFNHLVDGSDPGHPQREPPDVWGSARTTFSARSTKVRAASSWICWRGAPLAVKDNSNFPSWQSNFPHLGVVYAMPNVRTNPDTGEDHA